MANNIRRTDPLVYNTPIVDAGGRPLPQFQRWTEQQTPFNNAITLLDTAAEVSAVLDKISKIANSILVRGTLQWVGWTPSVSSVIIADASGVLASLVAPNDATKFLNGAVPSAFAQVKDSDLSLSDITTNNVSITKHGFAPKAPNDATKFLDGTGAYSTPAGGGTPSLTNTHIFVGNGSGVAADVAMSGDATIANTGAVTVAKSTATGFNVQHYARVGSTSAPTNTSDGDLTIDGRLFGGTAGLTSPSGSLVDFGYQPASFTGSTRGLAFTSIGPLAGGGGSITHYSMSFNTKFTGSNSSTGTVGGALGGAEWNSTGTVSTGVGLQGSVTVSAAGTVTAAWGTSGILIGSASGIITAGNTLYARSPALSGGATAAVVHGLQIDAQKTSGVTAGYGVNQIGTSDLNVFAGRTTVGSTSDPTPSAALDVNSTTGAFMPPRMTTTQRNALTASNGMMVYDTSLGQNVFYQNGSWQAYATISPSFIGFSPFAFGTLATPVAASFSNTRNASSTTSSISNLISGRGVQLKIPIDTGSTLLNNFWKWATPPAAGTDFSYRAFMHPVWSRNQNWIFGIYLADNSGTKKYQGWGSRNSTWQRFDFASGITGNPSGTSAGSTGVAGDIYTVATPIWFRIDRVSTTFNFYYSFDGETWVLQDSISSTLVLTSTLTEFGLYAAPNSTSATAAFAEIVNCYSLTGP